MLFRFVELECINELSSKDIDDFGQFYKRFRRLKDILSFWLVMLLRAELMN